MKYIYIMISQTQTRFAKTLRLFGGLKYNHASIAFDEDLKELYAFARSSQYGFLTAGLVKETTDRYTFNRETDVPIKLYRLPVTDTQEEWIRGIVNTMLNNREYMYNFFSVITYPITKGFHTNKAFSCIEFVMYILYHMNGIEITNPLHFYKPDDLQEILQDYLYFQGNLVEYMKESTTSPGYFTSITPRLVAQNVVGFSIITYRSFGSLRRFIRRLVLA